MDGLETLSELKNIKRWESLQQVLDNILGSKDEAMINDARFVWQTRYRRFWSSINFVKLVGPEIQQNLSELIESVMRKLNIELNGQIR